MTQPDTRHPSFPVVDAAWRVLGIVDPPAVLRWRRAGVQRCKTLAELLAGARAVVAYPEEYLDEVVARMTQANVAHIPVVAREGGGWSGISGGRT